MLPPQENATTITTTQIHQPTKTAEEFLKRWGIPVTELRIVAVRDGIEHYEHPPSRRQFLRSWLHERGVADKHWTEVFDTGRAEPQPQQQPQQQPQELVLGAALHIDLAPADLAQQQYCFAVFMYRSGAPTGTQSAPEWTRTCAVLTERANLVVAALASEADFGFYADAARRARESADFALLRAVDLVGARGRPGALLVVHRCGTAQCYFRGAGLADQLRRLKLPPLELTARTLALPRPFVAALVTSLRQISTDPDKHIHTMP